MVEFAKNLFGFSRGRSSNKKLSVSGDEKNDKSSKKSSTAGSGAVSESSNTSCPRNQEDSADTDQPDDSTAQASQQESQLQRGIGGLQPQRTNSEYYPKAEQKVIGTLKVRLESLQAGKDTPSLEVELLNQNSDFYGVFDYDSASFPTPSMCVSHIRTNAAISIPTRESRSNSRSSSALGVRTVTSKSGAGSPASPMDFHAVFDVAADKEMKLIIYDKANNNCRVAQCQFIPPFAAGSAATRVLELQMTEPYKRLHGLTAKVYFYCQQNLKHSYSPDDFQVLKLLGKGTFGQVYLVCKKDTKRIYAMKVLSKKLIVRRKEVAHTVGERNILVRTSLSYSPFIVGLKFSFQTPSDLYLVTDYMAGGELFWHLQKAVRFPEDRAKFYTAELLLALQELHSHGIVYRDLKPENILLDVKGHIALCDFGLSKANLSVGTTTRTFCGTTDYLAPEVILDEKGYTMMVDFWSLGVLLYEMTCGWSPFYADDTQQLYRNIVFGKVRFPRGVLSPEARDFIKQLLNRNPELRLGAKGDAAEVKQHPFFRGIDWDALAQKRVQPPFRPEVSNESDVSNFDTEFTSTNVTSRNLITEDDMSNSVPLSSTIQNGFKGFTYVNDSSLDERMQQLHSASPVPPSHSNHADGDVSMEEVAQEPDDEEMFLGQYEP